MARRPEDDRKTLQKNGAAQDREREQKEEKEETAQKEVEPEHARMQNQLGNQGVNALIANQTAAGERGGGVEVEMAKRPAEVDKEGQDYGGVDDGDPFAGGLGDSDLFSGWNPGTTQPSERTEFIEPMPDDELPDPNEHFLERVRERLSPVETADLAQQRAMLEPKLQPSASVIVRSLSGWGRGLCRWTAHDRLLDAWARTISQPPPLLQAADGRVLLARVRTAASASLLAASTRPVLHAGISGAVALRLQCELESRSGWLRSPRLADIDPKSRPLAVDLFRRVTAEARGRASIPAVPLSLGAAFEATISSMVNLGDPSDLVPRLAAPTPTEPEDEEDPYGVEAVLRQMTGGAKDIQELPQRAIIQGAERVAGGLQLTRYRFAGIAAAIHDTLVAEGVDAAENLVDVLQRLDSDTQDAMQRLRAIARAAQQRQQATDESTCQLHAVSDALRAAQTAARSDLAAMLAGTIPPLPHRLAPEPHEEDDWNLAWAEGDLQAAAEVLRLRPQSRARDLAIALTEFAGAIDPAGWVSRWERLIDGDSIEPLDRMLRHLATTCALREHDGETAFRLATVNVRLHARQRNAIGGVCATLDGVEALHTLQRHDDRERWRLESARALYVRGWVDAASLIARWTPAEDDEN